MAAYAVNFTLDKGTDFEEEFNLTEDDGSPLNLVASFMILMSWGVRLTNSILNFYSDALN